MVEKRPGKEEKFARFITWIGRKKVLSLRKNKKEDKIIELMKEKE